jgi:hypothetical protein
VFISVDLCFLLPAAPGIALPPAPAEFDAGSLDKPSIYDIACRYFRATLSRTSAGINGPGPAKFFTPIPVL